MAVEEHYNDIPNHARVVFDWDNTLKIVNREKKCIECSVKPSFFENLVTEKGCRLYIISAIRPSRMNMDTLLMEVDRLGIREFFCPFWQSQHYQTPKTVSDESSLNRSDKDLCLHGSCVELIRGDLDIYVRWGNIVICGYDKAEVFLEVVNAEKAQGMNTAIEKMPGQAQTKVREDVVDALEEDDNEVSSENEVVLEENLIRPVVFFDDEEVNILNFSKIVKDSICIWIK